MFGVDGLLVTNQKSLINNEKSKQIVDDSPRRLLRASLLRKMIYTIYKKNEQLSMEKTNNISTPNSKKNIYPTDEFICSYNKILKIRTTSHHNETL